MDYRILNDQGSFRAWGIGFWYDYDAGNASITVLHAHKQTPMIHINLGRMLQDQALSYVAALEKATQITALMYSNNRSIDLSDTIDVKKIPSIIKASARVARQSLLLKWGRHDKFITRFQDIHPDITLSIKKTEKAHYSLPFYSASAALENGTQTNVRDSDLHRLLYKLSQAVITDLITAEYIYASQHRAHGLLKASSDLNLLGCLIDKSFNPGRNLVRSQGDKAKLKPAEYKQFDDNFAS